MENPGGLGTFYADAITAAQTALIAEQNARIAAGQAGGTNVIVLLSDGAATSSSQQMGPLKTAQVNQECHVAITAAQAAATAGTWVYSIYYDDSSPDCSDTAGITLLFWSTNPSEGTSCATMQLIANIPIATSPFYQNDPTNNSTTDGTAKSAGTCPSLNPAASLTAIFQSVGSSLATTHLLPNNTM